MTEELVSLEAGRFEEMSRSTRPPATATSGGDAPGAWTGCGMPSRAPTERRRGISP
jgi:hypothetical protein